MIDLKECIKFCIENFTAEEATNRLYDFVNDSLSLQLKGIEIHNKLKHEVKTKEEKKYTIEYLTKKIDAIYKCGFNENFNINIVLVDPSVISKEDRIKINEFRCLNKDYVFVYRLQ